MKNVVSGLKPSGKLHIGNYLGVIKKAIELQNSNKYNCIYFIADYHSLTVDFKPQEKKVEIFEMIIDLLASGINPKKSIFFIQSHLNEHTALGWIFNNLLSVNRLSGMIEYKEKINEGHIPNVGLLDYPVLMAADILIYNADFVPVGEDQLQHLELTRDIARIFNNRFGLFFKEPKPILTSIPRVMSLNNPNKKMSKTLPSGCLYISDSKEEIFKKIKSAVTDSESQIEYNPQNRPAISNLILIYSEFSNIPPEKIVQEFKNKGYFEFKNSLAELVYSKLKIIHDKRKELLKNKKEIMKLLQNGASKAQKIAQNNLLKIKSKIGLI
ncbi:MAG: tryptophan--tRNA ligase [Patescibacteria group bacterium]|nr:tryptophan--tRNA ligase [Patescibacteria group bacterium]